MAEQKVLQVYPREKGPLNIDDIVSRVPPEIWIKIFKYCQEKGTKNLSKLRLVCKLWRQIVNEHFDMKAKIDDRKMSITKLHRFRRVTHCIVSNFIQEVPKLKAIEGYQIFLDATLITSLNIRGHISRENFWLLTSQCQNVSEFVIAGTVLSKGDDMFKSASFPTFAKGLKKLVATGIGIFLGETAYKNLLDLMNIKMPNLSSITLRVMYPESFKNNTFVSFFRQCSMLETLDLSLCNIGAPSPFSANLLPKLTTLKLKLRTDLCWYDWLPFVMAQKFLKHLSLFLSNNGGLPLENLEAVLENKQALEQLELGIFEKTINAAILFRGNNNLRDLKLQGSKQPEIINLNSLPISVENLELSNFKCRRGEFEDISNRVRNLVARNICFDL